MNRKLEGKEPTFHQGRKPSNIYRVLVWLILILAGFWLVPQVGTKETDRFKPLFLPTPTPTRTFISFAEEGKANFAAGNLQSAIDAYQKAVNLNPQAAESWAELARIQTYASSLLTTRGQQRVLLSQALTSINTAIEINPESAKAYAIQAFVLNWNASANPVEREDLLTKSESAAIASIQLEPNNVLALAFYAETLIDKQKYDMAESYAKQAINTDPNSMDAHRVSGYVMENLGAYASAIEEYKKAAQITPNLTFLYISIGANYRRLAASPAVSGIAYRQTELYNQSLYYFDKAAKINQQLKIPDPLPYRSIAKTYLQMGEFFIAARNMQKAIGLDPTNPDLYGYLGFIYFKSRNYEGSVPMLRCAVRGCSAEENEETNLAIDKLPLDESSVVYYYTYGSVLAALSRPVNNQCPEALDVLQEVRLAYPEDDIIAGIVQAGEKICSQLSTP